MRRRSEGFGDMLTFGGRVPAAVGGLIAVIVVASIFGALGRKAGVVEMAMFAPAYVLRGEVWRLVTWVFFENDPFSLIFGGLTLYWFGRDLCHAWGTRRFLVTYFVLAVVVASATCLVALVWHAVGGAYWTGSWPVILGLTVAWAMIFPERQILFMFALPVSGQALLWLTLGGTVLWAIFGSPHMFVPHLLAELAMVAYGRGWSLRGLWQSFRMSRFERQARRRASHLKVVKKPDQWMN